MIQLCFVLCFARRKVLPPTSQQQLTNKANGACIFDYLFKWKLINLNLKLIGFPACYTRVAFMKSASQETRVDGRAFWTTTTCSICCCIYCLCVHQRELRRAKEEWARVFNASSMFEYLLGCPMFELWWRCNTNSGGWANCHQPRNTNTLSCLTRARI